MKMNRFVFGVFVLSLSLTATSAIAQSAPKKRARSIVEQAEEIAKKEKEEAAKKEQILAEKKAAIPQSKTRSGFTLELGQDSNRLKDGKGQIDLSTGFQSTGMPQLVNPTEKIDFSMPLIYKANAGFSYDIQNMNNNQSTVSRVYTNSSTPFNAGASVDAKLAAEMGIGLKPGTHLVAGIAGGLSTDFGLNQVNQETAKEDFMGRPYVEVNNYSKGVGYAASEVGLSAGVVDPNLAIRAFIGSGNVFAQTEGLELGENTGKTYTAYSTQFMINDSVQGDLSAKVFNGDGNSIYKGSVYAKVSDDLWLGASARVMNSVTSVKAGIQWTPKLGAAE